MNVLYLETSAALTWLFGESRSNEVLSRLSRVETIVTSALTPLEAERALIRAERQGLVTPANRQRLRGMLAAAASAWLRMEVTAQVRARAAEPFPIEPLRTLDAIHLSTVLAFLGVYPELKLLSYDQRIVDNAQALGIG